MKFTTEAKIAEVAREVALRRNVYPKWVTSGRMKAAEAEDRIARLAEVAEIDLRLAGAAMAWLRACHLEGAETARLNELWRDVEVIAGVHDVGVRDSLRRPDEVAS